MEESMREEWKPVRGKEDWAEISNLGCIHYYAGKSKKYPDERWTYGHENNKGYLYAGIGGVVKGVHVWMYLTFVGEIPEGLQVNHLDENPKNNRLDNLNLMTPSQNINWGTRNTRVAAANKNRYNRSKAVQALDKDGNVVMEFPSTREAERQGFNSGHVAACCRGERKSHGGYIWCYKPSTA